MNLHGLNIVIPIEFDYITDTAFFASTKRPKLQGKKKNIIGAVIIITQIVV